MNYDEYEDHWPQLHPDDIRETFEALYAQYPFYGQILDQAQHSVTQLQLRPNHIWFEDEEALYVEFRRGVRSLTMMYSLDGEHDIVTAHDEITDEWTEYNINDFQMIRAYLGDFR